MPPATSANERTRIQLCGRLSVEIDGAALASGLRGKQVPLLLAYLVLHRGRYVGREELIGALWPAQAPVSQDGALRTLLSRLRSALGDVLDGRDQLILALPEPVWVDLEAASIEVERARDALAGGEVRSAWALGQVPLNIAARGLLPGSEASWIEPFRRELEDVRLQALEIVGRAGLRLGGTQLASAERAARSLIETEPYRESGYGLLMEALAAQGNPAEAMRVFDTLRTLLRDELGTMPSPETLAIHERLLRPSAVSAASAEDNGGPGSESRASLALPAELRARAVAPLVGRRAELAELAELWERASSAREIPLDRGGRVVLLAGEPGIGKTRLVAELARQAHAQGAVVLAGRAMEETLVPYQPFLETLRQYVLGVSLAELRATVREYGPDLSRLVPELRRRVPELPSPDAGEPETERYRLFEAVVGLLGEIAVRAPVLLVLDDLMWADRPSLLLLRHLARAASPARLLILGAYRSTEAGAEAFAAMLADLRRQRLVTQLEIAGLDEAETAELVAIRTGTVPTRPLARALHAESEGNPFFIEEIVRHLADAGVRPDRATAGELRRVGLPEGVKEVIARRLGRLDDQTVEWLRTAAVIGRDFDLGLLERVVGLDEDEFLSALEQALDQGLVVESPGRPGRYSFSHALTRETLYGGMSAPRRARTHRRVGEALEPSARPRELGALALHFTRAAGENDVEKAVDYARRAAEQAAEMLAHEEAAQHLARAVEVLDRFSPAPDHRRLELLLALGEARVRAGERPLAWLVFREAVGAAVALGDSASLARAAIGASRRYIQPPGVVDSELIEMLELALEATAGELSVERIRLLGGLCGAIYFRGDAERMRRLAAEATALAEELDFPEARALAAAIRRRAYWAPECLEQRLQHATELLRHARAAGDLELELQGHAWLIVDLLERGDMDAVDVQLEAFTAGAERLRQPLYLWNAALWRAMRALLEGHLEQADRLAAEAHAAGVPGEMVTAPQYYALQLMAIRREQSRSEELAAPARELAASFEARPAWRAALTLLLYEAGQVEEAREAFAKLGAAAFSDVPRDGDWLATMAVLSECACGLADGAAAAVLYELLEPFRDSNVVVGIAAVCLGPVERYLGRLAAVRGERKLARAHLERALERALAIRATLAHAHVQLDLAELLGAAGGGRELRTAAATTARALMLPAVMRRADRLSAGVSTPA